MRWIIIFWGICTLSVMCLAAMLFAALVSAVFDPGGIPGILAVRLL